MHIFPLMDLGTWSHSTCIKCRHFTPVPFWSSATPGKLRGKTPECIILSWPQSPSPHFLSSVLSIQSFTETSSKTEDELYVKVKSWKNYLKYRKGQYEIINPTFNSMKSLKYIFNSKYRIVQLSYCFNIVTT